MAAVVAAALDPAADRYGLTDVFFAEYAALMGSLHDLILLTMVSVTLAAETVS